MKLISIYTETRGRLVHVTDGSLGRLQCAGVEQPGAGRADALHGRHVPGHISGQADYTKIDPLFRH